jgi:hypothetical protein
MSLIGSLGDLGLGDILQIIHLSQKSGVLSIRGEAGEGRIVLQDGMVRLASLKGDPEDLRGLLVDRGFVSAADFEAAVDSAREMGGELSSVLSKRGSIRLERIDSLRRECIENAVAEMFSWVSGEFSFDVGAEGEFLSSDMSLATGVNPQYLAMESLRIRDEREHNEPGARAADGTAETGLNLELSAEEMFCAVDERATDSASAVDALVGGTTERMDPAGEAPGEAAPAERAVAEEVPIGNAPEALWLRETIGGENLPPVVVIDGQLSVLEWVRESLAKTFASVHIFQRSQEGLGRIRQYLARAQTPILLVSPKIEGNPLSGIVDAADFVRRLQDQAPRMPILWLLAEDEVDEGLLPVGLPTAVHPSLDALADANSPERLQSLARRVAVTLIEQTAQRASGDRGACASSPAQGGDA